MISKREAVDLEHRVAIVTGAGKGLGRAYALQLARCGARVLVNNRVREGQPNSADAVVAEIRSAGGIAEADYTDVAQPDCGERILAHALETFGALDTVVANAGMDQPRSFHKQDWDSFEHIFNINFFGTARLLHAAWPHLRSVRDARALVSVSTAGLYGNHGQSAYAAAKAALVGLVRSLAIESAGSSLRLNAIAPYAATPLTLPWFPQGEVERFTPQPVSELVAWLVSPACDLHGRILVSGGGGVREARMRETGTVLQGSDPGELAAQLSALPADAAPASASEEFATFTASLQQTPP